MRTPEPRTQVVAMAAWVAAIAATVLAPVHALSYYATGQGTSDLDSAVVRAWAEPAARHLEPLLDWADPDTVYVSYGKVWFFVFLAAELCAALVRRRRAASGEIRGAERWGWYVTLTGFTLSTIGMFGMFWTPLLDESFLFASVPGMLLSMFGCAVLGTALLRRGFRPRATGVLLVLWFPLMLGLSALVALGAAALPMIWAWGLAGRELRRAQPLGTATAGVGGRQVPASSA